MPNDLRPIDVFDDPSDFLGLPRMTGQRIVRVWEHCAFSDPVSYSLYALERQFLVRRVILVSAPFIAEPQPWGADGRLTSALVRPLLDELRGLTLAPFADDPQTGRDGCSYGVEVGGELRSARCTWWEDAPDWAALVDWRRRAAQCFADCLPAHRPG